MRRDGFEKTYSRVILSRISRGSENHPIRPGSCWWMVMSRKQSIIAWSSSSMLRLEADCMLRKTVKMMHSRCCEILAVLKTDGGMALKTCAASVKSQGVNCKLELVISRGGQLSMLLEHAQACCSYRPIVNYRVANQS